MEAFRSHYDVAVVGAGPTGCVTAIAHARRGARVLLLEASPSACCRFAGEWLHPPGAAVLGRLGITPLEHAARHEACRGFVVFPDDGSDAVVLPYANHALGISAEHELLVDELRCHVQAESGIDYRPYCRVEAVQAPRLKVVTRTPRRSHEVQACRIVGAEGRNSVVRQSLGLSSDSQVMSYMAGVDLLDVEMPFEGYGHVIVGAPGPMLLYRVGPRLVRACIDLPAPYAHLRRDLHKVWDVFGPHLPSSLQEPFRQALQVRQVAWAASRFRPRACYGLGEVAMVGDAVGHFHPLTASGMTIGFLDAETLARSPDVASYAREREGKTYVSELLASALYQVVIHTDETAGAIRQAIYSTWRQSQAERERTMRILAGEETRPWAFGAAFARVAGQALVEGVDDAHLRAQQPQPAQSRWPAPALQAALGGAQRARDLWAWSHWPLASLLPRSVRTRCRPGSLPHNPLGARLGRWLPGPTQDAASQVADVVGCASAVLSASAARSQHEVLAQSLEQRCVLLAQDARRDATTRCWAELSAAHVRLVDAACEARSLACAEAHAGGTEVRAAAIRVLTSRPLPTGEASRPCILALGQHLRDLQCAQSAVGWFEAYAATPNDEGAFSLHLADLQRTARVCQALDAVGVTHTGLLCAEREQMQRRIQRWLRTQQGRDGSWRLLTLSNHDGPAWATALALLMLRSCAVSPTSATVRRAEAWLRAWALQCLQAGRRWDPALGATVLHALVLAKSPHSALVDRLGQVTLDAWSTLAQGEVTPEAVAAELVCYDAVAALVQERAQRPRYLLDKRRSSRPHAHPRTEPSRMSNASPSSAVHAASEPSGAPVSAADWEFCQRSLVAVSRTFARPIEMLPPMLCQAVTCGYLLCRVSDTVEDLPDLDIGRREELYAALLAVLEDGHDPAVFAQHFAALDASRADIKLAAQLPRVMRVFRALPTSAQQSCSRWIAEMTRGMHLYSRRPRGQDGFCALYNIADLERYCYYVAGTVGHMLTELFVQEVDALPTKARVVLEGNAEAFGVALQLVNILKDVTDDQQRRWSFVPRALCEAEGLSLPELTEAKNRAAAHRVVAPLFALAERRLEQALEYTLHIPASEAAIRLFCLLPLWMAVRTLVLARGNDAMFQADQAVKISRAEVESLIEECVLHCSDDASLRARFRTLWQHPSGTQAQPGDGAQAVRLDGARNDGSRNGQPPAPRVQETVGL